MRVLKRFTVFFMMVIIFLAIYGDSFAARGWLLQSLCKDPRLYCIVIRRGESWENLFPNSARRDLVMRINRMNTPLWPGIRIAVPKAYTTNTMEYTPFPTYRAVSGKKTIVFSPTLNAWAAYSASGQLLRWGPGSGGQNWCPDLGRPCHTPSGQFRIYEKRGSGCFSTKFPKPHGGAPMPYCMFFKGGFAMHGSFRGVPGFNASHGCLRLFTNDAQWLNQSFADIGTQVIVLPYTASTRRTQAMMSQEVIHYAYGEEEEGYDLDDIDEVDEMDD